MHVVSIQHRHSLLQNDWPVVQMLVDKMHGAASDLYAVVQRLFLRVHARESRQQ